jgi:hypothetical protein
MKQLATFSLMIISATIGIAVYCITVLTGDWTAHS